MAPLRLWLRAILPLLRTRGLALAVIALCGAPRGSAAEPPSAPPRSIEPVFDVSVAPGESWLSLRARFCPLETIQAANPSLGDKLKPGDVVRSPFVMATAIEGTNKARIEAEKRA